MKFNILLKILLTIILFTLLGCKPWFRSGVLGLGGYYKLKEAEELSRQGKFDQAIQAYQEHMQYRLSVKDRPEWENPYFYHLLIGDIELGRGEVNKALEAYNLAYKNNIHAALISDRYRFVASWYEAHAEYEQAIALLKEHRDLDPLLFDAMLDRIAKHMTHLEDSKRETSDTTH